MNVTLDSDLLWLLHCYTDHLNIAAKKLHAPRARTPQVVRAILERFLLEHQVRILKEYHDEHADRLTGALRQLERGDATRTTRRVNLEKARSGAVSADDTERLLEPPVVRDPVCGRQRGNPHLRGTARRVKESERFASGRTYGVRYRDSRDAHTQPKKKGARAGTPRKKGGDV